MHNSQVSKILTEVLTRLKGMGKEVAEHVDLLTSREIWVRGYDDHLEWLLNAPSSQITEVISEVLQDMASN